MNSYAGFGEAYYNVTKDLKLTAGLRWTEDQKHFLDIPSEAVVPGLRLSRHRRCRISNGTGGRAASPQTGRRSSISPIRRCLCFFRARLQGRRRQSAGSILSDRDLSGRCQCHRNPIHPLTFKPEFIDAFELGTKNTLLDGALTLNGDVFYYNYKGYQISEIVDRTAINDNYNAHVEGAELKRTGSRFPACKFNLAGGWEDTALAEAIKASI